MASNATFVMLRMRVNSLLFLQNPITLSGAEKETYEKFKEKLSNCEGMDAIYDNINIEN